MKTLIAVAGLLLMGIVGAADLAVDFANEAVREKMPKLSAVSYQGGVADTFGSHGRWAYHFKITKPWQGGYNQWPSVTLPAAIRDWTGYDRLVVDVMSIGDGGDILRGFVSDDEGHIGHGLQMPGLMLKTDNWQRWVIPLNWVKSQRANTKNPVDRKNVTRVHFNFDMPFVADIELSGIWLLKPGEPLPEPCSEFMSEKANPARDRARRSHAAKLKACRDVLISRCRVAGQDGSACWIGKATSMERVMPLAAFDVQAADRFSLKLARGETEALQVIVMPANENALKKVSVKVGEFKSADGDVLAAAAFSAHPVGYVETKNPGPYRAGCNVATNLPGGYYRKTRPVDVGWFPEPVMTYLDATDIRSDVVQSFWVSCKAPRNQKKGVYRGELRVCGEGFAKSFPFDVRVYDFEVPVKSALPLAVSFRPEVMPPFAAGRDSELSNRIRANPDSPLNTWQRHRREWADFLTDHYFSPDWLYGPRTGWWEELARLKKEGRIGYFNLNSWCPVLGKEEPSDEAIAANITATIARIRPEYEKAKELGLLEHAYIYGCDECPAYFHRRVNPVIAAFRREFPGVKLLTTTYDETFGTATNSCNFDAYCPTTDRYAACVDKISAGRKIGKEVWWYIACNQRAPLANPFIEDQLIGCRQLMGAQAVKFRPDGFLYYQISIWNSLRPISGPDVFTDWNPISFGTIHGDGNLLCCGPDGMPLTTVRFENFRDGLEDFAYAKEFERVTGRVCEVPPEICRGIDQFTDDPAAYYRWRDAVAEEIEKRKTAGAEALFSRAQPVWAEGRDTMRNSYLSFRAKFDWNGGAQPVLRVTGSTIYRAYVNGTFVGYGPARTAPGFAKVDEWRLAVATNGVNDLMIEACSYNIPDSYQYLTQPGFLQAEIVVGGHPIVATPGGFSATELPRDGKGPFYSHQRKFPTEKWVVGGKSMEMPLVVVPGAKLLPRGVPYPEFRINREFRLGNNGRTYELPFIDTGFVGVKVRCTTPARVVFSFEEALVDGKFDLGRNGNPATSWHAMHNFVTWDIATPGEYVLESIEPYTMKYAEVRFESGEGTLSTPWLRQYRNPYPERVSFKSSDPEIDVVFRAACDSLAENAVDLYTDCPSRERSAWLCDSRYTAEAAAWLTGDNSIEGAQLENYALTTAYPGLPKGSMSGLYPGNSLLPTYMLWYVLQCGEHLARAGTDAARFKEVVKDRIHANLKFLAKYENADGLLENLPGWIFIEWSKSNDFKDGVNYPVNALWSGALDCAGRVYGRPDWTEKAKKVRKAIIAQSYDGRYFRDHALRGKDGRLVAQGDRTETCQYYQFYFGVATPESHPELWKRMMTAFGPGLTADGVYPSDMFFGRFLRLDLLARDGRRQQIVDEIRRYFGHMARTSGTLWEFADGHDSRCHAFPSYLAVLILRDVLGLRPDWLRQGKIVIDDPSSPIPHCELTRR